jgi:hypothetical protein
MSSPYLNPNDPKVWQNLLRQLDDRRQENKAAAMLNELSKKINVNSGFTFSKATHKQLLEKEVGCL